MSYGAASAPCGSSGYHGANHAAIINVRSAPLHLGAGNEAKVTIQPNGLVGVGTTAPAERLHVAGNVRADAYYYNSDARLKTRVAAAQGPSRLPASNHRPSARR